MFKKIDEKVKLFMGYYGSDKRTGRLSELLEPRPDNVDSIGEIEELRSEVNHLIEVNGRLMAMLVVSGVLNMDQCGEVLDETIKVPQSYPVKINVNGKYVVTLEIEDEGEELEQSRIKHAALRHSAVKAFVRTRKVTYMRFYNENGHTLEIITEK